MRLLGTRRARPPLYTAFPSLVPPAERGASSCVTSSCANDVARVPMAASVDRACAWRVIHSTWEETRQRSRDLGRLSVTRRAEENQGREQERRAAPHCSPVAIQRETEARVKMAAGSSTAHRHPAQPLADHVASGAAAFLPGRRAGPAVCCSVCRAALGGDGRALRVASRVLFAPHPASVMDHLYSDMREPAKPPHTVLGDARTGQA
ncbi:hypothetical protein DFH11DRAFT_1732926 [Phellopilus nigrolimitatus]|nr:hypothetical protein DFH11DRAFT_1732926 [Phellopilus nigrolimitatus]